MVVNIALTCSSPALERTVKSCPRRLLSRFCLVTYQLGESKATWAVSEESNQRKQPGKDVMRQEHLVKFIFIVRFRSVLLRPCRPRDQFWTWQWHWICTLIRSQSQLLVAAATDQDSSDWSFSKLSEQKSSLLVRNVPVSLLKDSHSVMIFAM